MSINTGKTGYRNIFLVQNRTYWQSCPFQYSPEADLVLTFDYAVCRMIRDRGGDADFIDHIADQETLERYNYEVYRYFREWHRDRDGNDLFSYREADIGEALRIEIWNELTYYPRMLLNLIAAGKIPCENLYAGLSDNAALEILETLKLPVKSWSISGGGNREMREYYFPIFRWMNEKVYPGSGDLKSRIKQVLSAAADMLFAVTDRLTVSRGLRKSVYVCLYYPTTAIMQALWEDKNVLPITDRYLWSEGFFSRRRLASPRTVKRHLEHAERAVASFERLKVAALNIEGYPIDEILSRVFVEKVRRSLPGYYAIIDSIEKYFQARKLALMVSIANIGVVNCLVMDYCRRNDVPVYIIINGLLTAAFEDDAKNATWINAYGTSIRDHYFRGMNNVVCLGDPRMDAYADLPARKVDTSSPTIVIGAAGFNNANLNSYLAFEFDFLYDILMVLREFARAGRNMRVKIKVRANGYRHQYEQFAGEYFDDLPVTIYDSEPIAGILESADLYVSIYSQTLFEASMRGIPVIYYKKDTEIFYPPFDCRSELVTAVSTVDLSKKIAGFFTGSAIFDPFRDRAVMEKYMGPLDGHNLERNIKFIYDHLRN